MDNLLELTGYESGIVIYDDREVIICNWTGVVGFPRLFSGFIIGLDDLKSEYKKYPIKSEEILKLLENKNIIYDMNKDYPDSIIGENGYLYDFGNIKVITLNNWN